MPRSIPECARLASSHGLISYQNIVDMDGLPDFGYYIPGILQHADMPEIVTAIAPRSVIISSPVSIDRKAVGRAAAIAQYAWARDVYRMLGYEERLSIGSESGIIDSLRDQTLLGGKVEAGGHRGLTVWMKTGAFWPEETGVAEGQSTREDEGTGRLLHPLPARKARA